MRKTTSVFWLFCISSGRRLPNMCRCPGGRSQTEAGYVTAGLNRGRSSYYTDVVVTDACVDLTFSVYLDLVSCIVLLTSVLYVLLTCIHDV